MLLFASSVLSSPISLATYSDSFARNTILPLSSAAYSSNPQTCLTNVFKGQVRLLFHFLLMKKLQLKRQVNVKYAGDTISGYTATLPSQKAIVISFRSVFDLLDLLDM